MASLEEVLEAFREFPDTTTRGTAFEDLMVRYLELDQMYAQRFDAVWRWPEWPGRDGRRDDGIDLVARERDTGDLTAIQCKFYDPGTYLTKDRIDSFFTESGKKPFKNRMIITTTSKWSATARAAVDDQHIPVQVIGPEQLSEASIDWSVAWPGAEPQVTITQAPKHEPRPHQRDAIEDVFAGFAKGHERGKLVMACGTGKTFTALKIAERIAEENGGGARILFAVPSISLLSQTMREWTAQTRMEMRSYPVCSDTRVSRAAEDISVADVPLPATTNPEVLAEHLRRGRRAKGLTVVFTTYQSLPVVAEAQKDGELEPFDLVIADEAHRTTGVTVYGEEESNFVRIHDAEYLAATRRLYMTATPRIFDENTQTKAEEHSAELASMDDEDLYGPEFHRLSFGAAVERGLLTDYKVLVLTVDEDMVAAPLQEQLAGADGSLRLDDASKLIGCWNGLAKRGGTSAAGTGFAPGELPMRRAVAFAKDIKTSKQVETVFPAVVDAYRDMLTESADDGHEVNETNFGLSVEARHVDGTFNAQLRHEQLAWLKAPVADDECRVLTNARCLSEGVDVPALDAVIFLNPRNSVVDVVQSVGRVMRKAPGKDYGYIILPVAVPAGMAPSEALGKNAPFKVVWQVLNALRAHDERFNAMVNSIDLNRQSSDPAQGAVGADRLLTDHVGPTVDTETIDEPSAPTAAESNGQQTAKQMALFSLSEWQEAIYARVVQKVGTRTYWEDWAKDVAGIASALVSRINAVLTSADQEITGGFEGFLKGLQDNLNDSITADDAVSMLAQHLITKPVFDALFEGHEFAERNPVAVTMQNMVALLGGAGLESETAHLQGFYDSVRRRASEVTDAAGKQRVIADLYERFFKLGFARQAEALGIVYTPVEIVDFILRAANDASKNAFGRGLSAEGVHILDPFTGTGTFITRLLQSGLIEQYDLARKYASELHANEIMLLAYYIAAVNIETTYHAITGETAADDNYEPFEGVVLADTFQITEDGDSFDELIFPQNNDRITRQLATPINVIIGNPPYSVGQGSANDLNANTGYPTLDARITDTYAKLSTATNKNSLYDSYLRAFRWATDRIGDKGIVAFVSNGGWIDGNTADGIRLTLASEYSRIYVYNLRGNARSSGELRRREAGNVFGSGARTTIAIWIGIKDPTHTGNCELFYKDIGDFLTREEKLTTIGASRLETLEWQKIIPNTHGDWLQQRSDHFTTWPTIGTKRPEPGQITVFKTHSAGLQTNRDVWVYNSSSAELKNTIQRLVANYNAQHAPFAEYCRANGITKPREKDVTAFLRQTPEAADPKNIKWSSSLHQHLTRGTRIEPTGDYVTGLYRPFFKQRAYFGPFLSHRRGELDLMFPTPHNANTGFYVVGAGSDRPFSVVMTDVIPDLAFWGSSSGQFFPRWTYETAEAPDGQLDLSSEHGEVDEWGYRRADNITDEIRDLYTSKIGEVSKDDIFYYVYGILHDPEYREEFAADLKKMLPHIPTPETRDQFDAYATAGKRLSELHIEYENVPPYPVNIQIKKGADPENRETWRVKKMRWAKKKDPVTNKNVDDKTSIIVNPFVTISDIPEEADRYMLGSRSALGWILDRYQVKTDKPSGITNDPNDWADEHDNPRYIADLIAKVVTVAVETMRIVSELRADPR